MSQADLAVAVYDLEEDVRYIVHPEGSDPAQHGAVRECIESAWMMQHWSIFGTACSLPEPEQVLEVVQQADFPAARIAAARRSLCTVTFSLYYAPSRAPLFIDLEELIPDERDVNTGSWEMAEDRITDHATLRSIRCYADVRYYENADPAAVEAAVEFLRAQCGALSIFSWEMR